MPAEGDSELAEISEGELLGFIDGTLVWTAVGEADGNNDGFVVVGYEVNCELGEFDETTVGLTLGEDDGDVREGLLEEPAEGEIEGVGDVATKVGLMVGSVEITSAVGDTLIVGKDEGAEVTTTEFTDCTFVTLIVTDDPIALTIALTLSWKT